MVSLSCYCFNGGYLTTDKGEDIALCFEEDKNIPCNRLTVTGYYTTVVNKPEPTSPCRAGEMRYFKVVTVKCLN